MRSTASKEVHQQAKRLLQYSLYKGRFDPKRARRTVKAFIKVHPRGLTSILVAFKHLVRQKLSQEMAIISLSYSPTIFEKKTLSRTIIKWFGDVTYHFRVDPTLVGGMRIEIGDIILESSLAQRARLFEEVTYGDR